MPGVRTDRQYGRRHFLAFSCALVLGAGCAKTSTVSLQQPGVQGRQRGSTWRAQTYWFIEGKEQRILVELPLPGLSSGKPMFILYLRTDPPLRPGTRTHPEPAYVVRGFLIQLRGEYAGRVASAAER